VDIIQTNIGRGHVCITAKSRPVDRSDYLPSALRAKFTHAEYAKLSSILKGEKQPNIELKISPDIKPSGVPKQ
jgi:hypothetical protein